MLVLPGTDALSEFRLARLRRDLADAVPGVRGLEAVFVHFVDTDRVLDARERGILEKLLCYGGGRCRELALGALFLVIPRPGTISPWASKATDIAHNCGLAAVNRIERGVAHIVTLDEEPGPEPWRRIAERLHDRMTQIVVPELGHAVV